MAFTAILGAVVFGLVFGVGKLSDHSFVRWPCWLVVEFFRAVPVIMLMIFFFYAVFADLPIERAAYWGVVTALTLYNGAVLAEVFRAGINAVPKGQSEAAYAIGMRKSQVMNIILLPQAVKIMIPAIISQCVVALKDTSLGYLIAAPGLTRVGRSIYIEFANHVPTILVLAVLLRERQPGAHGYRHLGAAEVRRREEARRHRHRRRRFGDRRGLDSAPSRLLRSPRAGWCPRSRRCRRRARP